jgi:hypothetical protein
MPLCLTGGLQLFIGHLLDPTTTSAVPRLIIFLSDRWQ